MLNKNMPRGVGIGNTINSDEIYFSPSIPLVQTDTSNIGISPNFYSFLTPPSAPSG